VTSGTITENHQFQEPTYRTEDHKADL